MEKKTDNESTESLGKKVTDRVTLNIVDMCMFLLKWVAVILIIKLLIWPYVHQHITKEYIPNVKGTLSEVTTDIKNGLNDSTPNHK